MSYGLTVAVLGEVLPLKNVLAVTSVRRWMNGTSCRIEADLKHDSVRTADEFKIPRPYVPEPSPVKAIGVDGGYVRLAGHKSRSDGWFEVIVGKRQRTDRKGACFAYVHRLAPDPGRRIERFFTHEGIHPDQPVTFFSDGGDTVRQAQFGPGAFGDWILDWFNISMRFQNLTQIAKGLPGKDQLPGREEVLRGIEGAKWHLWHGCWYRAIRRLESLTFKVSALRSTETTRKLQGKLSECINYINKNKEFIVDYTDRHRYGDPIATGFVESAVNQVVSKRLVGKQQMSWSAANADSVLQVRTTVLNEELRRHFKRWYPSLAATGPRRGQHAA